MTGLYVAIECLVPDEDENDTLRQELNLYIDLNGQFGSPAAKRTMTKVAQYVEDNDDWTIPTEDELQDFVDGGDDLLWSDVQEAMGKNVDAHPNVRRKGEHYRDDDDDIVDVGNDLDEEVNALDDVGSDAEPVPCD
ncbi:unnamed protein product [Lactuca saligna]|uniref:Uncharacterized protein n=1 Tax=Lactuca saligna TaxID=75948 RepID=A0AA35Y7S1_LACSI|nr:unnamed protein product [Lactuca saligna]